MIVSIYKNVTETTGYKSDIFYLLTTDKWRNQSDQVRAESDKVKREKLKRELLPAFTPSGIFKDNERNDKGLIKHSGYMCIDIDEDDNPHINDWQNVITQLGKLPEIAFAGLSVSGRGVFLIIPIKYPDRHKEHFNAFQRSFKKRGLIIDCKCGNLSRLRFYSYNKDYYLNKEAVPYKGLYKPEPINQKQPVRDTPAVNFTNSEGDVEALVNKIVEMQVNIVPDYQTWFKVGAALSNVSNGRELFHRISSVDLANYNFKICDKQFSSIKPGRGITINTLFYIAKHYGVEVMNRDSVNWYAHKNKPAQRAKKKLFAEWSNDNRVSKHLTHAPSPQIDKPIAPIPKLVCFVDKEGKLYIPTPCSNSTYTVYKSVEQYQSRKGLPQIVESEQVDISQMSKRDINLNTLLIE